MRYDGVEMMRFRLRRPGDIILYSLENTAGVPILCGQISANNREKVLDDALGWLRNNSLNHQDDDDPTVAALANLPGLSSNNIY
jgi:hypothetical protein